MNFIKQFFSYQYLFQVNPAFVSPQEKLFFFFGAILALLGIVLKIAAVLSLNPVDKKYRLKFYHLFLTMGLSEVIWYLCRRENVSFFNTRFVAWLIILIGIIWFIAAVVNTIKNYSREKEIWEKEQVRQRYLPV
jgi:hypothetical protein